MGQNRSSWLDQRDSCRLLILRRSGRYMPHTVLKVDVRPPHGHDSAFPGTGPKQQSEEVAPGVRRGCAGIQKCTEFLARQKTIPRRLLIAGQATSGVSNNAVVLDGECKESA